MPPEEREVATSSGPARVVVESPPGAGTLVLTHGSAGGTDAADLRALGTSAVRLGWSVVSVEQPFRVAGRRSPGNPERQDQAWREIIADLGVARPLVLAGRSNGARVACRTANDLGASGVIALAFPVHPPGNPHRSRLAELAAPSCPVLVVQGERDPFGMPGRARGRRVAVAAASDHSLRGAAGVIEQEAGRFLRRIAQAYIREPGVVSS